MNQYIRKYAAYGNKVKNHKSTHTGTREQKIFTRIVLARSIWLKNYHSKSGAVAQAKEN